MKPWLVLVCLLTPVCAHAQPWPAWNRLLQALAAQHLEISGADPRRARIETIGKALIARQNPRPPWDFVVVASPKIDAGCCGEGAVYVTSGLLDLHLDDDELAGILGHEVAHGIMRHVETNQQPQMLMEQARKDQQTALEQVDQLERERERLASEEFQRRQQELAKQALELKERIAIIQASARKVELNLRAQEADADSVGLQLARLAGYREEGLLTALAKIQEAGGSSPNLAGYRHPPIAYRLGRLRQLLQILHKLSPPDLPARP
ncbi:MAG: M48 family metalloprotease [Candidatus Eremiobacteraeota bacterium]|nr:M48 family metalloprotease [Candidatus Eremiobacteraeota bacterium]MCW5867000.1 M48 family metalloprotease [Candidatus Eremiobacteraeota bacterium]